MHHHLTNLTFNYLNCFILNFNYFNFTILTCTVKLLLTDTSEYELLLITDGAVGPTETKIP